MTCQTSQSCDKGHPGCFADSRLDLCLPALGRNLRRRILDGPALSHLHSVSEGSDMVPQ